jgi:HAD superfamily phosphoserine phosphatase-like hydrolase
LSALQRRFRSIVLDVDNTLSGLEGVDWLARRRGAAIVARVESMTQRAMDGELDLEKVYGARLSEVAPDIVAIAELSRAYVEKVAPDAATIIGEWLGAGMRVVLISGGIRSAILPLASWLGIPDRDVHAVTIRHTESGAYDGFDESSPLTTATGKREIVAGLGLVGPTLAAGDGRTDLAMREVLDCFAAYTGFIARPAVTAHADFIVRSFRELNDLTFMK